MTRTLQQATPGRPIRDYEIDMEATYQYVVAPWWQLQPDLQYVVHPGGNIAASDRFPHGAPRRRVRGGAADHDRVLSGNG